MTQFQKIIKYLFIIYIFSIASLGIIVKYSIEFIDDESLYSTFDELIPISLIILISAIFGIIFFRFGYYKNEESLMKTIIGYLSFIVTVIFINYAFTFILLIGLNSLLIQKDYEKIIIRGEIIEVKSYKLSRSIFIKDSKSDEVFNLSVNKKFNVGENFKTTLKKGYLNINYK